MTAAATASSLDAKLIAHVDVEDGGGATSPYKYNSKTRTNWVIIAIVVAAVIILVAVGLLLGLGLGLGLRHNDEDALADMVAPRLDRSADPCEDFYQFACGGFNSRNSAGSSTFAGAQETANSVLQDILDNGLDNTQVEALQKTKQLYDSCLDTGRINALGVFPLLELIRETGGWALVGIPSTMPWDINGQSFMIEKELGSPAFFDVDVSPDARNSSALLLQLTQSGLSFPIQFYLDPRFVEAIQENLIDMITEVLGALYPNGDVQGYEDAARNIWELERNIANIWVSNAVQREAENTYNRMTIGDLSTLWADYNWNINLPSFIRNVGGPVVDASEAINVQTPDYFRSLSTVFTTTNAE